MNCGRERKMRRVEDRRIIAERQIDRIMDKCLRRPKGTKIVAEIFSTKGHFIEPLNSEKVIETTRGFLKQHFLGGELRLCIFEK